jgi:hypothetical protein
MLCLLQSFSLFFSLSLRDVPEELREITHKADSKLHIKLQEKACGSVIRSHAATTRPTGH